jgi:hypothetical protein
MVLPFSSSNHTQTMMSSFATQLLTSPASTTTVQIPLENRSPIMATFISLYALIFFFGITGNALVVRKCNFLFRLKNFLFLRFTSCRLS